MAKYVCPVCGKETEIDDEETNLIHTYNVIADFTGEPETKNICKSCGFKDYYDVGIYQISSIKDKSGNDKTDEYSLKRLNKRGKINIKSVKVGRPLVFFYENENGKFMRTTKIESVTIVKNGTIICVSTKNSDYMFVRVNC